MVFGTLVALASMLALAAESTQASPLSVDQILEKNVAARGGLAAWQKIEGMVWSGKIESPDGSAVPFVLAMKRPNKTRFEINRQGQVQLRAFDGEVGWKLRPGGGGGPDLQAFNPVELAFARDGQGFDGPLIDHQAKGIDISYAGAESVDGQQAYRLNLKLRSGTQQSYWLDAKTFLEIKSERFSRDAQGHAALVSVYYRDYQLIEGLRLPAVIETHGGAQGSKLVVGKFLVNPPLEDRQFSKPTAHAPHWHDAVARHS